MRGWLKEARTEKGLSMKQMGEKLDVSESYYSLIESGQRQKTMDITLVSKISSALGVSVAEIVRLESMPDA